jgi:hypothetical protein
VVSARFGVGDNLPSPEKGLRTYHIGNSLTDTVNASLKRIADSTGVEHAYARCTSPGATVGALATNAGFCIGTPEGASRIDTFARSWAPIDHLSVQPFADPSLDQEGAGAVKIYELVRAANPDVQLWIYAQWPSKDERLYLTDSLVAGAGWSLPPWNVPMPRSWEDALQNQLRFHEAFRDWVDARAPGKPVRIIPAGPALQALKAAIERGEVPGMRGFFEDNFDDDLHLSLKGQYLVGLVFYACLYQQNPVGQVTHEGSTLSDAQARIYQQIAWDTVRNYPHAGLTR